MRVRLSPLSMLFFRSAAVGLALLSSSSEAADSPQPIRVIGAGPGRTGTSSLTVALTRLGYKPYHMKEGVFECGHMDAWGDFARAKMAHAAKPTAATEAVERAALAGVLDAMAAEGFDATTDFPASAAYDDLMEAFPDARVVLGVRESGAKWAESVDKTIGRVWPLTLQPPVSWFHWAQTFAVVNEWMWTQTGVRADAATGLLDFESLAPAHDAWIERVKKTVPADRLLVHSAKDGFAPLCAFLGVDAADCPDEYPWVNDGAVIATMLGRFEFALRHWVLIAIIIAVSLAGLLVATVRLLLLHSCGRLDHGRRGDEAMAVLAGGKEDLKSKSE